MFNNGAGFEFGQDQADQNNTYYGGQYNQQAFDMGMAAYNHYQPSPQDMYNAAQQTHQFVTTHQDEFSAA